MALIDIEFRRQTFAAMVGVMVRAGPAMPFPTVPPLGEDRLIREVSWEGEPAVDTGLPGYTPPAGAVLLRFACHLSHVSVDELRADAAAFGASADAQCWLQVSASPAEATVSLVAVGVAGQAPVRTPMPIRLGALPLPSFAGVIPVRAALVTDDKLVVLRIASSLADDPLGPPQGHLAARREAEGGGSFNWLIHVPPEALLDLIRSRLAEQLDAMPPGATIERGPTMTWAQLTSGQWGARGQSTIEIKDACPGLFGDVDISIDVSALASFADNPAGGGLDVTLTITADASDWDSFRCWLGSGGIASLLAGLIAPFLLLPAAIASLIVVAERVRTKVGDRTASAQAPGFTEVAHTGNSKTFRMTIPPVSLPFSTPPAIRAGARGVDFFGQVLPIPGTHETRFQPDHGPLRGTWNSKVDCASRQMHYSYSFQPVIASDSLKVGENLVGLPVVVFPTSVTEPPHKCAVNLPNAAANVAIGIEGAGLAPGETGFAVLHTSAGLRAYRLGPVPRRTRSIIQEEQQQRLVDSYCGSFQVLRPVIEIQEIRWAEPPPGYDWGMPPLRHWQIITENLPETAEPEIYATGAARRVIASASDFTRAGRRAATEIVTDAENDLILHVPRPPEAARFAVTTRWLLPLRSITIPHATAMAKTDDQLMVRVTGRWTAIDQLHGRLDTDAAISRPDDRNVRRPGHALAISPDTIALVHDDAVIIAMPVNTLHAGPLE